MNEEEIPRLANIHSEDARTRIYVTNSLDLVPVVQRQWRTLIFGPISVQAAQAAWARGMKRSPS